VGHVGVAEVCSVPCNRRVADLNLPITTASVPWTSCLPKYIVCEEDNGQPPHSSHPRVAL